MAIDALSSMGEQFGLAWQANARKTRGTDEVLNICIGDGYAPTKIEAWIHACTLTTKVIIKYAADKDAGLPVEDIVYKTSDLCRQVARVAAQTVCPEAMRESGN